MKIVVTILFAISFTLSFSQRDFNNYRTLLSSGETPVDFTQKTYLKIEEQSRVVREGLTKAQQKEFLEAVNYGIDDILQSNLVVYGDEISNYVAEIAAKLLQDQTDVLKRLRFYTLKSNETNALSTDQGIIFVTTGLISQLTSEAQLAYVLAHEIAHYTENHVIDKFEFKSNSTIAYLLSGF